MVVENPKIHNIIRLSAGVGVGTYLSRCCLQVCFLHSTYVATPTTFADSCLVA